MWVEFLVTQHVVHQDQYEGSSFIAKVFQWFFFTPQDRWLHSWGNHVVKFLERCEFWELFVKFLQVIADFANGEISQAASLFDCDVTLETYMEKSFYKTASLIAASCRSAAVFSGMPEEVKEDMFNYGKHLGLAFQVYWWIWKRSKNVPRRWCVMCSRTHAQLCGNSEDRVCCFLSVPFAMSSGSGWHPRLHTNRGAAWQTARSGVYGSICTRLATELPLCCLCTRVVSKVNTPVHLVLTLTFQWCLVWWRISVILLCRTWRVVTSHAQSSSQCKRTPSCVTFWRANSKKMTLWKQPLTWWWSLGGLKWQWIWHERRASWH